MINLCNKHTHTPTPHDFYVGRGSVLGNVFSHIDSKHPQIRELCKTREESIEKFKPYLEKEIRDGNPQICDAINRMIIAHKRGEDINLVCFCSPLACHGEVIRQFVEKAPYCINWFSNMKKFSSALIYQGVEYWSVENFYQAAKMPKDQVDLRAEIAALTPHQSKTAIRDRSRYPWREDWNHKLALSVMEYALRHKFAAGTSWGEKLKKTSGELVEWSNWKDITWGRDIFTGEGDNALGEILMRIREELKKS